jgi:ribonuclease E
VTAEAGEGEQEPSAQAAETSKAAEKPSRGDEEKPRRRRQKRVVVIEEDDGFGAGLEVEVSDAEEFEDVEEAEVEAADEEATDEERPRKRRRRGGRRRGRRKQEEQTAEGRIQDADEAATAETEEEDDEADEEAASRQDKYRSVPTWEEAISYLVRREPKKSAGVGKSSSGSRRGRRGSSKRRS